MKNAHIVFELTNNCNLQCFHCMRDKSAPPGYLPLEIIKKVLGESKLVNNIDIVSFTGGEPTLHPQLPEILKIVSHLGYSFGLVTNGWHFPDTYRVLLPYKSILKGITFSLDGAKEETHDRLRGKGSYRRVMQAVSICIVRDIPFTFNTSVTSHNYGELKEVAELVSKLGSRGLRFGHLMPTPLTARHKLDLPLDKQREVENTVSLLQGTFPLRIAMAPRDYITPNPPCTPLRMEEFNIDWRGNLTLCCNLSGYGSGEKDGDIIGNLCQMSYSEAYGRLVTLNRKFCNDKRQDNRYEDSDSFPCWYCLNYFKKMDWLKEFPGNPWSRMVWTEGVFA
ncbi:MAG: radical SAM protein [Candidatus Loosdrechtia sp.]|uniref:radical SAM protein n=1 Tax=Candidatus Loosdrechtia sp. TaxID=3101272 RepID=UPI003A5E7627|nr:MAG: radical SAM protein [Candidatus Jettenia sp. AMX2]